MIDRNDARLRYAANITVTFACIMLLILLTMGG
jgi:hypothetical protein